MIQFVHLRKISGKWALLSLAMLLGLGTVAVFAAAGDVLLTAGSATVTLTVGSTTETFTLKSASLSEFTVQASSVNISTGAGETATFEGPSYISFGASTDCSGAGVSRFVVQQSTSVTITPTKPASTDAEFKNSCDGRVGGGGGDLVVVSGGGGGGGNVVVVTPTTPAVVTGTTTPGSTTPAAVKVEFKDIGTLPKSYQQDILRLAQLMVDMKTYKVSVTKRYSPSGLVKGDFAIQIWNTVAGIGCGSETKFPGTTACLNTAVAKGLVPKGFPTSKKVTRLQNYEFLLRAHGIALDKNYSVGDLKEVCSDVKKPTNKAAQVFFTARKYGIASKYKGNKCKLDLGFFKKEAARFAVRAIDAKVEAAPQ